MHPGTRYPLGALEELRRRRVDEARGELADAVAEGRRARRRAQEGAEALQAMTERRRTAEQAVGGARGEELGTHGRWVARLRREEQRLGVEAANLAEEAVRTVAREERRRGQLVEAERQLRTVERHRELWDAERLRAARSLEEAEQDDRALALAPAQRRT